MNLKKKKSLIEEIQMNEDDIYERERNIQQIEKYLSILYCKNNSIVLLN